MVCKAPRGFQALWRNQGSLKVDDEELIRVPRTTAVSQEADIQAGRRALTFQVPDGF